MSVLAPKDLYSLKSVADLPDDLALEVKAFPIWLVIIIRQRSRSILAAFGSTAKPRSPNDAPARS